jgi:hypothetical protein
LTSATLSTFLLQDVVSLKVYLHGVLIARVKRPYTYIGIGLLLGRKCPKIAENRRKLLKIAENCRNSPKLAENCDLNVDPRSIPEARRLRSRPELVKKSSETKVTEENLS